MDVCIVITYSNSMDQPVKVTNLAARGQLNRENEYFFSVPPENLVSHMAIEQYLKTIRYSIFESAVVLEVGSGCLGYEQNHIFMFNSSVAKLIFSGVAACCSRATDSPPRRAFQI